MKWYQVKEQAAGEKRLMTLWYLYKFLGKDIVCLLTAVIAFCAFCSSKQMREYSKKNLSVIFDYTNNGDAKPTFFNSYRLVLNYALSLVDRMEVFAHRFDDTKIVFDSNEEKTLLETDINEKKGIFFICSHIGNIEVLRTFVQKPMNPHNPHVNIFLSETQCRIFNGFLKRIQAKTDVSVYPVENISIDTAIEMKDKLDNSQIAFMAGDRISSSNENTSFKIQFLNRIAEFPLGTFKFAQMMETPVYFIAAIKDKKGFYKIHLKKYRKQKELTKSQNTKLIQSEYINFLEEMIKLAPLQFYHFYNVFG
ncbi:MAG: hypothetical protein KHX03_01575 [Clostridium sp.]|nr:hypothetical protein [Clostridium sp.]